MKVLVTGSRLWTDVGAVVRALEESGATHVAHGGARGADAAAGVAAARLCLTETIYRADWNLYGKSAGPIRNAAMLEDFQPDLVLAFLSGESRGTWDCIRKAERANIPVSIVSED